MFESATQSGKKHVIDLCCIHEYKQKPVCVEYVFYENIPTSHRIAFRNERRTLFEVFVDGEHHWLKTFCQTGQKIVDPDLTRAKNDSVRADIMLSLLSFILGKRRICCLECLPKYTAAIPQASLQRKYLLVLCTGWKAETVFIFQCKRARGASPYRRSQSFNYNWIRMSVSDFRRLLGALEKFPAQGL